MKIPYLSYLFDIYTEVYNSQEEKSVDIAKNASKLISYFFLWQNDWLPRKVQVWMGTALSVPYNQTRDGAGTVGEKQAHVLKRRTPRWSHQAMLAAVQAASAQPVSQGWLEDSSSRCYLFHSLSHFRHILFSPSPSLYFSVSSHIQVWATECIGKSQDNMETLVLPFPHVDPRDQTQLVGLAANAFVPWAITPAITLWRENESCLLRMET